MHTWKALKMYSTVHTPLLDKVWTLYRLRGDLLTCPFKWTALAKWTDLNPFLENRFVTTSLFRIYEANSLREYIQRCVLQSGAAQLTRFFPSQRAW